MRYCRIVLLTSFISLGISVFLLSWTSDPFPRNMGKEDKTLELKELLSFGKAEGEEAFILYQPVDIEVCSNKNIYVLDSGKFSILKYDKEGKYLLSIGRKGQGPGEIDMAMDFALDSMNNLYIFDIGNNRISRFSSDGEILGSIKTDERADFSCFY
jgi:hypothetical protein